MNRESDCLNQPPTRTIEDVRRKYCFVTTSDLTVYHVVRGTADVEQILQQGFKPVSRWKLHLSFTPNIYTYPAERLLAVVFAASESKPLIILDETKIQRGSAEAGREFSRILKVLPGLDSREECLTVGFPGYICPCGADDRISISDPRELVLYDFNRPTRIEIPSVEEIARIRQQCRADETNASLYKD